MANVRQIMLAAGRTLRLQTGVALLNTASLALQCEVVEYRVRIRPVNEEQAEAYVRTERAWDCAGGFRAEGLGVALIEHMEGADPTSLIGLPLISLVSMLKREGMDPLAEDPGNAVRDSSAPRDPGPGTLARPRSSAKFGR